MSTWSDSTNTVAAVASAVATAAACFVAVRGNRAADRSNAAADTANEAAASANRTAEAVARIEHDRRLAELTPQFNITLGGDRLRPRLHIYLSGPDHLGHLDEIKIRVENDDMVHEAREGDPEVTQEDYDKFVWGPFRFLPEAEGVDRAGQTMAPFSLDVGKGRPLVMERTRRGFWMTGRTQEEWQSQYQGYPVRLVLTCRRGDDQWVLARPVDQPGRRPSARRGSYL